MTLEERRAAEAAYQKLKARLLAERRVIDAARAWNAESRPRTGRRLKALIEAVQALDLEVPEEPGKTVQAVPETVSCPLCPATFQDLAAHYADYHPAPPRCDHPNHPLFPDDCLIRAYREAQGK